MKKYLEKGIEYVKEGVKKSIYPVLIAGGMALGGLTGCPSPDPDPEPKTLNKLPVAQFSASPTKGYAPLEVNFNGSESYDRDGEVVKYLWDFGDGKDSLSTSAEMKHVYEKPGNYNAGLTVYDVEGAKSTKSLEGIVVEKEQIAFMSTMHNPYWEIYTGEISNEVNIENVKRLTDNGDRQDLYPFFSPDGKYIAFTTNRSDVDGDGGGDISVHVMNSDGNNPYRVSPPLDRAAHPVWSNDKIYFNYVDFDGFQGIASINPNKTDFKKITSEHSGNLRSGRPAVSPDGKQIAYVSFVDGNGEIYVANSKDGSNKINITNHPSADDQPAWSPDGKYIAFVSDRAGNGSLDIYLVEPNGKNLKQITSNFGHEVDPAWSSDGSKIAFAHDEQSFYNPRVYIMNSDGSDWKRVVSDVSRYPAWRPHINE